MDSEILVVLNFQRLAKMGETGSIGFKLSTCKVLDFFTEVCKRLPHGGTTIQKIENQNAGLYSGYL